MVVGLTSRGVRLRRCVRLRPPLRVVATTRAMLDYRVVEEVGQKPADERHAQRDMWAVLVHAPMRSCHMPWCRIPGLKHVICSCLKDGVDPPSSSGCTVRSKDGKCALTVAEYAEVLAEGVPVLTLSKAHVVATTLFESAMVNSIGMAVVIVVFRQAAVEYQQRLINLGLRASIAPVDCG